MQHHFNDILLSDFKPFKDGCPNAFRIVFDRYHETLYRYALTFSKDEFKAEEVVQEIFIKLFKHKQTIESPSGIYPYLFVLMKRALIANHRKELIISKYNNHLNQNWSESCNNTLEQVEVNELEGILQRYINELPPKQKEIYQLNKLAGLSYKEISVLTGSSINTIKNQLISASNKIKLDVKKYLSILFLFLFTF